MRKGPLDRSAPGRDWHGAAEPAPTPRGEAERRPGPRRAGSWEGEQDGDFPGGLPPKRSSPKSPRNRLTADLIPQLRGLIFSVFNCNT